MESTAVAIYRPFKIPRPSGFIKADRSEIGNPFMIEDLAKSGLEVKDLFSYAEGMIKIPQHAECGYVIPYFDPDGRPIVYPENDYPLMFRTRLKQKPFSECQRYIQPGKEELAAYGLPPSVPYFPPPHLRPESEVVAICEGEKKTAAVAKHLGLYAIGIGGCWNWANVGEPHPWILHACTGRRVILVPDADVMRYDIAKAYGNLASFLTEHGCDVEIVKMPDKADDWIVAGGTREQFDALPRMDPTELNQTQDQLISQYNLAYRQTDKAKIAYEHTSNVMRLMEAHPAFPFIWENLDKSQVYAGDNLATPDLTEMDIANYFQHNLGMPKVTHRQVRDCIGALKKRNAKSPFLEWVRQQEWDGTERLATWMPRLWGVEDSAYSREICVKWLVGSIARMEEAGVKIDWMLIVIGPQATGKTSMPGILFKNNEVLVIGQHHDKDFRMLFHAGLCVCFDELDSFAKRDMDSMKAMVTAREDTFRKPYAATVERNLRRSVLYGCGNEREILQDDPSGHRRYAILEVDRKLNFAGLEAEAGQLWAEAYHVWSLGGCSYWEVEGASERAQKYVQNSPILDRLDEQLKVFEQHGSDITKTALTHALNDGKPITPAHYRVLSAALRKRGYETQASNGIRKWVKHT